MKLVVTEKNIAAQKIADLLGVGKPKADKVYSTPVYRFERDGEEWVTIGLRGHILEPNFVPALTYKKRGGWIGVDANGEMIPADLPTDLPKPPFKKKKPFVPDGVELNAWKMDALPYLIYAPIEKLPKEKDIIRSLKNLAKKADSIVIATDFDREGELIGSDALTCIREVNEEAPVSRARYSAITKEEITRAFTNLVELDVDLAQAGASRQDIDLIWGAVLTRYLTLVKFAGYGNVRSSGRVQTPTLALIVARERERLAFVPEDYWAISAIRTWSSRRIMQLRDSRSRAKPIRSWSTSQVLRARELQRSRRSNASRLPLFRSIPLRSWRLQALRALPLHVRCALPRAFTWMVSSRIRASIIRSTLHRSTCATS